MKFAVAGDFMAGVDLPEAFPVKFAVSTHAGIEIKSSFKTVAVKDVDQFDILIDTIIKTESQRLEIPAGKHITYSHCHFSSSLITMRGGLVISTLPTSALLESKSIRVRQPGPSIRSLRT